MDLLAAGTIQMIYLGAWAIGLAITVLVFAVALGQIGVMLIDVWMTE